MIRKVKQEDAAAIAAIYNDHVKHTCVTFEDEEVSVAEMQKRISEISSHYPIWFMRLRMVRLQDIVMRTGGRKNRLTD